MTVVRDTVAAAAKATGDPQLRLGVAGLGRAFTMMLPTFTADPRIRLVAATDPRADALERFARASGAHAHHSVAALCSDPAVDAVYVATPHGLHAEHVLLALAHGKHVLVEKPMAITLGECQAMIAAADDAGVQLVIGHSHSFDAPVAKARALIDTGAIGPVRMINAQYYTDFLYRLRRPEELATSEGGGVLFSQAAHQVDIVRLLGGGLVHSVRALTGAWDPARPTEGAYAALLTFSDGAFASLLYSGYGHFDSDILCGGIGETGTRKHPEHYGRARRELAQAGGDEAQRKAARNDAMLSALADPATPPVASADRHHEHFGMVIVSGERGDLHLLPDGVMVYGDDATTFAALPPPAIPRVEVIDELYAAIVHGVPPRHDGRWALATLETCIALLQSAREHRDITLCHQTGLRPLQSHAQSRQ